MCSIGPQRTAGTRTADVHRPTGAVPLAHVKSEELRLAGRGRLGSGFHPFAAVFRPEPIEGQDLEVVSKW